MAAAANCQKCGEAPVAPAPAAAPAAPAPAAAMVAAPVPVVEFRATLRETSVKNTGAACERQNEINTHLKNTMATLAVRLAGNSLEDGPEATKALDATIAAINRLQKMITIANELQAGLRELTSQQL